VIIPEPEAVEYVRVCDAYGTGYFYIPGTETCMQIGGYVRVDVGFGELNGADVDETDGSGADTYNFLSRATVTLKTRKDTEYGTLSTDIELRGNYSTNADTGVPGNSASWDGDRIYETGDGFYVVKALIGLGGFSIGKADSVFTTFTGYGGAVINDTTGGGYGKFGTNQVSYTFTSGAFTGKVALEQGTGGPGAYALGEGGWLIDDYVPHVVAGASFDAGMFTIAGVVGFDTSISSGWAGKVRVDAEISDAFSVFVMPMYTEAGVAYGTWSTSATADTFSVIGGASFAATDQATLNAQVQWAEGNGGSDVWAVAANVAYEVTDGFVITPEVQWARNTSGDSMWGGLVRFQRSY